MINLRAATSGAWSDVMVFDPLRFTAVTSVYEIDTLEMYRLNGIIDYGDSYRHLASTCHSLVAQVRPRRARRLDILPRSRRSHYGPGGGFVLTISSRSPYGHAGQ